jgi:hypothetical protein
MARAARLRGHLIPFMATMAPTTSKQKIRPQMTISTETNSANLELADVERDQWARFKGGCGPLLARMSIQAGSHAWISIASMTTASI